MNTDLLKHERVNRPRLKPASKKSKNVSKGFTLVELLVVVAIVITLATIGMYFYNKSLAYAKETVCETNLRAIEQGLKLYATENDALPASLGQLKLEHLEKGYAKAMKKNKWITKLCFLLLKFDASDKAYAQFLTYENLKKYGVTSSIFHCPADKNGGASYGLNSTLEGKKWSDIGEEVIIVADSDDYLFNTKEQLAKRHHHKAIGISKTSKIVKVSEDNVVSIEEEENVDVGEPDEQSDLITICHKEETPAEKTMVKKAMNQKTIKVPKSDLDAYLRNGDTIGPCDDL